VSEHCLLHRWIWSLDCKAEEVRYRQHWFWGSFICKKRGSVTKRGFIWDLLCSLYPKPKRFCDSALLGLLFMLFTESGRFCLFGGDVDFYSPIFYSQIVMVAIRLWVSALLALVDGIFFCFLSKENDLGELVKFCGLCWVCILKTLSWTPRFYVLLLLQFLKCLLSDLDDLYAKNDLDACEFHCSVFLSTGGILFLLPIEKPVCCYGVAI